ncbi:MAG: hypothetical protein ABSG82_03950 [Sedimentisphaerales bacterium]|jgi:uncharacterized membrane protein YbhN (UPF0104 family)
MNRFQKIAWFNLIVALSALGLSVAAFAVFRFVLGLPVNRAVSGFAFIGIMGFSGLSPVLFKKDKNKVQFDERDTTIQRKAAGFAYSIFWLLFVAAAMVPWFIIGPNGTITTNYLPWMVFGGMLVVMLVQSLVTLKEYGWRGNGDK